MSILHLTPEAAEAILSDTQKPILADFWASWCAPCRMFSPIFEKASEKLGDEAIFVKINVDECEELAARFSVSSIPTIILIKNGKETARRVGALSLAELSELLNS